MNLLDAILHSASGVAESAARYQLKHDPKLRRELKKKHAARSEGCTPCAATGYVQDLRKAFGG